MRDLARPGRARPEPATSRPHPSAGRNQLGNRPLRLDRLLGLPSGGRCEPRERRTGRTRGCRRTSASAPAESRAGAHRSTQRAGGRLRTRAESDRDQAGEHEADQRRLRTRCRSGIPLAWYWPQPQIENGDSRPSCQPSVRFQKMRAASIRLGSSSRIAKDANVAAAKPATKTETARGRRIPQGYDAQSGTTKSGATLSTRRAR